LDAAMQTCHTGAGSSGTSSSSIWSFTEEQLLEAQGGWEFVHPPDARSSYTTLIDPHVQRRKCAAGSSCCSCCCWSSQQVFARGSRRQWGASGGAAGGDQTFQPAEQGRGWGVPAAHPHSRHDSQVAQPCLQASTYVWR
jgi:hypothetical protein